MSRTLRKLRIAFSATCGISCVLLIALWVRSYWACDTISLRLLDNCAATVISVRGQVVASACEYRDGDQRALYFLSFHEQPATSLFVIGDQGRLHNPQSFSVQRNLNAVVAIMPHWFIALISALLAPASFTSLPRFSLRTLLIAMTLVAVALGALIYATG
jgi:hypothetical protein